MARKAAAKAEPVATEEAPKITAIKGFNHALQSTGGGSPFQFEMGETYTVSGRIKACTNGFHAVDPANPLHVWDFYPVMDDEGRLTRYAEVELSGATDREKTNLGTKIAAAEINVKVELSLPDFIKRAVNALIDLTKKGATEGVEAASGDSSQLAASGDSSQLAASGHYSVIAASGPGARASGKEGTWIALAEFDGNYRCIGFATGCVGKDGLKPNTPYIARGGKLVEAA